MKNAFILSVCLLAIGCQASYEKREYDVTLTNYSAGPVTIWLTKDGPPFEDGWLSPEDIALGSPKQPVRIISGLIVQTGKTAYTGPRFGQFEPQTHAVLRVYSGQLKFEELLAATDDEKRRIDLRLHQGKNELVVTGTTAKIDVKDAGAAEPAK